MGKVTIDEETLDEIGKAIIAKGGATAPMKPGDMAGAIYAVPGRGDASTSNNDVNFYLPDGTIAKSYTVAEFADLATMPDQPTLYGLTAQGWNWTLADAKAYVSSYGKLDIGGMYVTDNGETRLYLTIAEPYLLEQPLRFGRSGGTGITVDWGDGSAPVTYTNTEQTIVKHTYPGVGNYVIRILPMEGAELLLVGSTLYNIFGNSVISQSNPSSVYSSRLRKVEIGSSVTSIGPSLFRACYSLSSISIPSSVTSIGPTAIYNCGSLLSVTIPSSVTSIGLNAFGYSYSLSSISIPSSVTSIETNAFQFCRPLLSVAIPPSVTSIESSVFKACYSLSSVAVPPSVSSIGSNAFTDCYGVVKYDFTKHTTVPSLSDVNAFSNIATGCKIVVPDALYDEWITATNWSGSEIVSHIVKAS